MGLFENIEKLITEHGSSAILKERIALVKEQYAALEQKLTESELRINELLSKKERFELENFRLKEQVKDLEDQLSASQGPERLDEVREKILVIVSQHDNIADAQIAHAINIKDQLATFHLKELEKMGLVHCRHIMGSEWTGTKSRSEWSIMQPGRSYLVEHGLLQ